MLLSLSSSRLRDGLALPSFETIVSISIAELGALLVRLDARKFDSVGLSDAVLRHRDEIFDFVVDKLKAIDGGVLEVSTRIDALCSRLRALDIRARAWERDRRTDRRRLAELLAERRHTEDLIRAEKEAIYEIIQRVCGSGGSSDFLDACGFYQALEVKFRELIQAQCNLGLSFPFESMETFRNDFYSEMMDVLKVLICYIKCRATRTEFDAEMLLSEDRNFVNEFRATSLSDFYRRVISDARTYGHMMSGLIAYNLAK